MIAARRIPFAALADNAYTVTRPIRGISRNYTVNRTVVGIGTDPDNRQLTINVVWTRIENGQTRSYNHQVATIVRR